MTRLSLSFTVRRDFWWRLVAVLVGLHGLYVVSTTLLDQLRSHGVSRLSGTDIDLPLIIGIGLIYLSSRLMRRKRVAWLMAAIVYVFTIGLYSAQIEIALQRHMWIQIVSKLLIPLLIIGLLVLQRNSFRVRSDVASFRYAIRIIVIIMVTAFVYGTAGFLLLDSHDFHREIGVGEAMHRTIDQFGLTTSGNLQSQTRRAELFVESLSLISVSAATAAVIALFQPIRARYSHRNDTWSQAESLLQAHGGSSEDFFKLWPKDKDYRFDSRRQTMLAFRARSGVALVVGDPAGKTAGVDDLLSRFEDECFGNDWQPAFVHVLDEWAPIYQRRGYHIQKIGEEAVVDITRFNAEVRRAKYFREVTNKFKRKGYVSEVLLPPHSDDLIKRLRDISEDWLTKPGRAERGFMLSYFSEAYMQQSTLIIARDSAGTIQAFLNQIPSFDPAEANYDLLRSAGGSLGNINDFVLLAFIDHLAMKPGVKSLNMGLCPLSGMDEAAAPSLITKALHFVYDNGDRFYSFSGLRRFKSKYQPEWRPRSVAYKGSPANFVRIMTVLTRAMRVPKRLLGK